MSGNQGSIGDLVAAVSFSAATPPVVSSAYGVNPTTGVVRNAKGDWTVTLQNQIDQTDRVVQLTCGSSPNTVALNGGSDSTVGILSVDDAHAAQDSIVHMAVFRTAVG